MYQIGYGNNIHDIFRIKGDNRREWMTIIRAHQSINDQKAVYICDLHFNESDLIKNGKNIRPKKNAMPLLG